jgi:hypothetical protein
MISTKKVSPLEKTTFENLSTTNIPGTHGLSRSCQLTMDNHSRTPRDVNPLVELKRKKPRASARERNLRRLESNERERLRMHGLNAAFEVNYLNRIVKTMEIYLNFGSRN